MGRGASLLVSALSLLSLFSLPLEMKVQTKGWVGRVKPKWKGGGNGSREYQQAVGQRMCESEKLHGPQAPKGVGTGLFFCGILLNVNRAKCC